MKRTINPKFLTFFLVLLFGLSHARSKADVTYNYDAQGRLTQVTYGDSMSISYTYDPNSNVLATDMNPDDVTSVAGPEETLPDEFGLAQNFPNPFNPTTQIKYQLPVAVNVRITVYNLLGEKVRTLVDAEKPAGDHNVTWDGTNDRGRQVATGVYLYRLRAEAENQDTFVETQKMLLMK